MCICFGRVFKEYRVIIIYVRIIINVLAKNINDSSVKLNTCFHLYTLLFISYTKGITPSDKTIISFG